MKDSESMANKASDVTRQYAESAKRAGEQYQRSAERGLDAVVRSWSEFNSGFTAMAAEVSGYSKQAFDDAAHALEQLVGAKSIDQAVEIQSRYAKKAYDDHVAEVTKLSQMYFDLVKSAYRPVEKAASTTN